MLRKMAVGNWKMHGGAARLAELDRMARAQLPEGVDVVICPPATLLDRARAAAGNSAIAIGAQDCHAEPEGAFTGDISAPMIAETGARYVILGHSERRAGHHETDADVAAKARAARAAGLTAIICLGESEQQRERGDALDVIRAQLAASVPDGATPETLVVAYEPIWAIGTGRTAEPKDITEVHAGLRDALTDRFGASGAAFRLLYGGSVKPGNAAEIFAVADVHGALVGGASLTAGDFLPIIAALADA